MGTGKRLGLVCNLVVGITLSVGTVMAEKVTSVTLDPAVPIRGGTVAPQEGVELYVFDAGAVTGQQHVATVIVTEQPAAVVGVGVDITNYVYSDATKTLTLTFKHVGYMDGAELYGPDTDFSLAFIPAGTDQFGIPMAMRGSWMATNVGAGWNLVPPSEESYAFGFELEGPAGQTGFFRMFIAQGMIDLLSDLYGQELTAEDLAVFNDNGQASLTVTPQEVGGEVVGALVDINVTFQPGSQLLENDEPELSGALRLQNYSGPGGDGNNSIKKKLTVDKALEISLAASQNPVVKRTRIKLYGWVPGGAPGDTVKLTSSKVLRAARVKGNTKRASRLKTRGWKRLELEEDGYFSVDYVVKSKDVIKAIYKRKGQRNLTSEKVVIKLAKRS